MQNFLSLWLDLYLRIICNSTKVEEIPVTYKLNPFNINISGIFRSLKKNFCQGVISLEKIINDIIEKKINQIINSTQKLVQIKSVLEPGKGHNKPFGEGIFRALDYSLKLGRELELKSKNIDGYAGYIEIGQGDELIGVLCHLDVVPEGSGWDFPPYDGKIHKGKLYGRGSLDDKGPTVACIFALKAIQESGLPVTKRARIILGTDEETQARGIKYYLKKEEKPLYGFSPDAEFPVIYAEKGILRFDLAKEFDREEIKGEIVLKNLIGGTRVNVVPDRAKAELEVTSKGWNVLQKSLDQLPADKIKVEKKDDNLVILESIGKSAHGSYPEEGINAISLILSFLNRLNLKPNALREFIRILVDNTENDVYGQKIGISCKDEVSGPLTLNLGIININKKEGRATFDVRYPVSSDKEVIWSKLNEFSIENNIILSELQHKPPLYVDRESKLIKKLQKVYTEMTGQDARLISIGGGTYCRYLKNFVAYGPVFPGQKELAHQPNEYISISDLIKITKIYAQAIYELIK